MRQPNMSLIEDVANIIPIFPECGAHIGGKFTEKHIRVHCKSYKKEQKFYKGIYCGMK